MNQPLTFAQYRAIDLALFGVVLCIVETLIVFATTIWFPEQLYTVSITGAVVSIVLMRWGKAAAIHAVLGGFVFCLASRALPAQYAFYIIGNLFSMISLLPLKYIGGEKIRNDSFLSVVFGLSTLLYMQLGRALVAILFGNDPHACLGFLTTDSLSLLFTGVVVWIARRLDGIFEDQKHYIIRSKKEE